MAEVRRAVAVSMMVVWILTSAAALATASDVTGSFTPIPAGSQIDLTAAGTEQWLYFAGPPDSKTGSPVTIFATGESGGISNTQSAPLSLSWSDGTPDANASGRRGGIVIGPTENSQWGPVLAHIPSGPTVIDLYLSATDARISLLAQLGNGGPTTLTVADAPGQTLVGQYALSFLSSPPSSNPLGQTVDLSLILDHAYGPDAAGTWQALAISSPEPAGTAFTLAICLALTRARRSQIP